MKLLTEIGELDVVIPSKSRWQPQKEMTRKKWKYISKNKNNLIKITDFELGIKLINLIFQRFMVPLSKKIKIFPKFSAFIIFFKKILKCLN